MTEDYISFLPDPIILQIIGFLPIVGVIRCQRLCHNFYNVASDNIMWKAHKEFLQIDIGENINMPNYFSIVANYCKCWSIVIGMLERPEELNYKKFVRGLPYPKDRAKTMEFLELPVVEWVRSIVKEVNPSIHIRSEYWNNNEVPISEVVDALLRVLQINLELPASAAQEWISRNRKRPDNSQEYPKGWIIRRTLATLEGKEKIMFGREIVLHQKWVESAKNSVYLVPKGASPSALRLPPSPVHDSSFLPSTKESERNPKKQRTLRH